MQQRLASLHQTESVAVSFDGWDNLTPNRALIGLVYHWVDTEWVYHMATGRMGYYRAFYELVEGLGRTRVPEEEERG